LSAVNDSLCEIADYVRDCYLRPKAYRFTPEELSRYEIIQGGARVSSLVSYLKEGAL